MSGAARAEVTRSAIRRVKAEDDSRFADVIVANGEGGPAFSPTAVIETVQRRTGQPTSYQATVVGGNPGERATFGDGAGCSPLSAFPSKLAGCLIGQNRLLEILREQGDV